MDLLKSQEIDFLLAYQGSVAKEEYEAGLFESVNMGEDELVPVCRTSFMVKQLYEFPATADFPLPFIGYMPGSAWSNMIHILATNVESPVHLNTIIETGSAETIKAFIMSGYGLSWLPRLAIQEELANGTLTELGDQRHRIPFYIELTRLTANTNADILLTWDKLKR